MLNNKTSELLDFIIECAKKIGGYNNSALTPERFIYAVLEVNSEPGFVGINELSKAERLIIDAFASVSDLKSAFEEHFSKNMPDSPIGVKLMDESFCDAYKYIMDYHVDTISVDIFLYFVLENAKEYLKKYSSHKQKTNSTDNVDQPLSAENIKNTKDQISKLTDRIKNIRTKLLTMVLGQENAIDVFSSGLFQSELLSLTDKERKRPAATFLFAGPPGVGKTFLAESAANVLELPFRRFDMSEYSDEESNIEFCGSDKAYKNGSVGNVTSFVASNPKCLILFDEIEKAHLSVIHLFLQILDAGRLRDNYTDKEVSFANAIIIITTNAGKQLYSKMDQEDLSVVSRKVVLNALQNDINPLTNSPYFPRAICSRFASGNVVMFNHIGAHSLREIAKKRVLKNVENFNKTIGFNFDIDERVFSALLFAEGGLADARTVTARAESFLAKELFELFRLVAAQNVGTQISDIENVNISVELSKSTEIVSLFEETEISDILLCCSNDISAKCSETSGIYNFFTAESKDKAKKIFQKQDIKVAIVDINFGKKNNNDYLNLEDYDSLGRDLFWYIRQYHSEIPLYILETDEHIFSEEERISYLRQGARGIISLDNSFGCRIKEICTKLHQQQSMTNLARSNRLVTFETAQSLSTDGKNATITLFDFETVVALDSEDSKNVLSRVSTPNIKFSDVIGAEEAKQELGFFAKLLKEPKKYRKKGVSMPKGLLLYGPSGTGKTMLAKAMACESDVTFITAEGNQFLKKYVGEGQKAVHDLFATARKYAPTIIFVDEIDAIAKERTGNDSNSATDDILTAFLTEMDGFNNDVSKPVFVLAATNYDVEIGKQKSLDEAFLRRFNRKLFIGLPNREERARYLNKVVSSKPFYKISKEKIENIALRSVGMSLAELESVLELALRFAIREDNEKVTDHIFDEAFETFTNGEKKNLDISQLERIARHESGHALLCWLSGETPSYLTVVSRSNHGGYMQHGANENKSFYTKEELLSKIRISLGGRAAEIVYYGAENGLSTAASGDLSYATEIAQKIICNYGMDNEFGLATYSSSLKNCTEPNEIRSAINRILSEQLEYAVKIITENKQTVDLLAETLIEKNHVSGLEIDFLLNNSFKTYGG